MNKINGESNENVCRRFGIISKGEGMSCGMVEVVKCCTEMVWTFGKIG